MSSIWVNAICEACKKPLTDRDKAIAVIPATMREKTSHASGYGKDGYMRVMPSKGRKDKQKPEAYHEACWPGVRAESGK